MGIDLPLDGIDFVFRHGIDHHPEDPHIDYEGCETQPQEGGLIIGGHNTEECRLLEVHAERKHGVEGENLGTMLQPCSPLKDPFPNQGGGENPEARIHRSCGNAVVHIGKVPNGVSHDVQPGHIRPDHIP